MNNFKATAVITVILFTCNGILCAATATKDLSANVNNSTALTHQDILNHMLLGELAEQRDMPNDALYHYMIVAQYTNNPEVAQQATQLALQIPDSDNARVASTIWANAAPDNLDAQLIATTLTITNEPSNAAKFLHNAFALNSPDIDQQLLFILSKLSAGGQRNLTAVVFNIAKQQPTNPYIQLTAAQLAAVQSNFTDANAKLKEALALKPGLTAAIELKAKLIRSEKNADGPALEYLAQQVSKYPSNGELRMFFIMALNDNNAYDRAMPQLEVLTHDKQYAGQAFVMLGEIAIRKNNYTLADQYMQKASKFDDVADKAQFYLGQLAESKNDFAKAISWYESISEDSDYHTIAFLRAAYLYSANGDYDKALNALENSNPTSLDEQKQVLLTEVDILISTNEYDQALENCDKVLNLLPDDLDFLYARSIVYSLQHKDNAAEKDLRAILAIQPDNADALNALGYSLSNQPSRLNEAMPLLQKALNSNPDNPSFMDSMGWLLYKKGDLTAAISMLTKAYALSGDAEIAAHLGEVLWAAGKQDAAKTVWNKALSSNSDADSKVIQDTLLRLNIPLSTLSSGPSKNIKAQATN